MVSATRDIARLHGTGIQGEQESLAAQPARGLGDARGALCHGCFPRQSALGPLPLLAAWLLGYIAAFHAQQWLRLRRISRNPKAPRRHVRPALVFGAAFAVCGLPLAVLHPWLVAAAACAAPFVAANTYYAWRNNERALLNGLLAVVPACGMLLVALHLGGGTWADGWRPALACLLYFGGTVPYVKTMIRERDSRAYYRGSVAYHGVALVAAAFLTPWLALPFAAYLARAALLLGGA